MQFIPFIISQISLIGCIWLMSLLMKVKVAEIWELKTRISDLEKQLGWANISQESEQVAKITKQKGLPERFYVLTFRVPGKNPTYDEFFVHCDETGMIIAYDEPEEPSAPSQAALTLYWVQFCPEFHEVTFEKLKEEIEVPITKSFLRGATFLYGIKLRYFQTLRKCIRASGLDPRFDIELGEVRTNSYLHLEKYAIELAEEKQ